MFKHKDKEYDETKLSEKGKVALGQLQMVKTKQSQMSIDYENLNIIASHWLKILEEELPKEEEKKD